MDHMFSRRFHWISGPTASPRRWRQAPGRGAHTGPHRIEPHRAGLEYPPEIVCAFDDPRMLAYEPSPAGAIEAREAVASYYAARGVRVETERILLTASTSEAYAWLFKLLCDAGDQVLVPRLRIRYSSSGEPGIHRGAPVPAGLHGGWSSIWTRSPPPFPNARARWCWSSNNPTALT